mgnify:FL=1
MSDLKEQKPAKMPKFADSKDELADILGVSRSTVQRASAVDGWPKAAANGRWHVEKCRAFITKHFNVLKEDESGAAVPEGFTSWKEYGDAQKGQREAVKLAKERGLAADKNFVRQATARFMGELYAALERRLCAELPPVTAGQEAIFVETKNREALREAFGDFKRGLEGAIEEKKA